MNKKQIEIMMNNEMKELFPESQLHAGAASAGDKRVAVMICGTIDIYEFFRFSFQEKWIEENIGEFMDNAWREYRIHPSYCGIERKIDIHVSATGISSSIVKSGERYARCGYRFEMLLEMILTALVRRYESMFSEHETGENSKYILLISSEPDDDSEKRLDYYSEHPEEGLLDKIISFNSEEELEAHPEIEGYFYQLYETEGGKRIGYGMVDADYPLTDVRVFEKGYFSPNTGRCDNSIEEQPVYNSDVNSLNGQLVIISGFSRAGKDTIAKKMKEIDSNYYNAISVTTREPRKGERNEVDYYFVSDDQFQNLIDSNAFLEWAEYCGHKYGTLAHPVCSALKEGKNVILVLETEGAMKVKEIFPQAVSIFLTASAKEILRRMDSSPVADREQRIEEMLKEISVIPKYDYCISNERGSVDEKADLIHKIVVAARLKSSIMLDVIEKLRKDFESAISAMKAPATIPLEVAPAPCAVRMADKTFLHIGDRVIHFKWEMDREGNTDDYIYEITGFPKNTETEEQYVSYRSVSDPDKEWVRPYDDFFSTVDFVKYPNIKQKYRFVKVD